jgi:hypothetical protein
LEYAGRASHRSRSHLRRSHASLPWSAAARRRLCEVTSSHNPNRVQNAVPRHVAPSIGQQTKPSTPIARPTLLHFSATFRYLTAISLMVTVIAPHRGPPLAVIQRSNATKDLLLAQPQTEAPPLVRRASTSTSRSTIPERSAQKRLFRPTSAPEARHKVARTGRSGNKPARSAYLSRGSIARAFVTSKHNPSREAPPTSRPPRITRPLQNNPPCVLEYTVYQRVIMHRPATRTRRHRRRRLTKCPPPPNPSRSQLIQF